MKNLIRLSLLLILTSVITSTKSYCQTPGQVDPTFVTNLITNQISTVQCLQDGKILVCSQDGSYYLHRLNNDGTEDFTFNQANFRGRVQDYIELPDSTLIICSIQSNDYQAGFYHITANNDSAITIAPVPVLYPYGIKNMQYLSQSVYSSFPSDLITFPYGPGVNIMNNSLQFDSVPYFSTPDGSIVSVIKVVGNKLYAGTNSGLYRCTIEYPLAVVNSDDSVFNQNTAMVFDTSFNCDISAMCISNGELIVGGAFNLLNNPSAQNIIKIDVNGNLDSAFALNVVNDYVMTLKSLWNGKIVIGGAFTTPKNKLASLNNDGTSDSLFNSNLGTSVDGLNTNVLGLCIPDDNNIIVAGLFGSVNGVVSPNLVKVSNYANEVPSICLVTVDSVTGKNVLLWEKEATARIGQYNIYKENGTSVYSLIGTVPYSDFSSFVDTMSTPPNKSDRYKISAVDTLGIESSLSDSVRSIHLTISLSPNGDRNLTWNEAEGYAVFKYYVRRGTSLSNFTLIDSTASSTQTSYTDTASITGPTYYLIETINPNGCFPTARINSAFYSVSRSNTFDLATVGVNPLPNQNSSVKVFPNPFNDYLTIQVPGENEKVTVQLIDAVGKSILNNTYASNQIRLQMPAGLSKGVYTLLVSDQNKLTSIKVVK